MYVVKENTLFKLISPVYFKYTGATFRLHVWIAFLLLDKHCSLSLAFSFLLTTRLLWSSKDISTSVIPITLQTGGTTIMKEFIEFALDHFTQCCMDIVGHKSYYKRISVCL